MEKLNQVDGIETLNAINHRTKPNSLYRGAVRESKAKFRQCPEWKQESLYVLSTSSSISNFQLKKKWYDNVSVNKLVNYYYTAHTSITNQ